MRRRLVWTTAMIAVLLVLPSAPASAAEFTLEQPDGDVTDATPIEVLLERDFTGERFARVEASLRRDDARLGETLELACARGCEVGDREVTYELPGAAHFDPHSGAPFHDQGPLANGPYTLQVDLRKESNFQSDETFEAQLHLAVPPSPPERVEAEAADREVTLDWRESPEPDIEQYRIERHDGEDWEHVGATSKHRYVDEPGEGTHRYRIVAERSDGRDGTLETASADTEVEVASWGGAGDDDGGDDEDREADTDGEDRAGDDDEADGGDGSEDAGTQSTEADRERSGGRSRGDAAEAPDPTTGSSSIPGIRASGDGDDEGYTTELDYGDLADGEPGDVTVANPSGWRGTIERVLDPERIAVPVATGLVMTGMGLHLWRWLRVPVA